MTKNLFATVLTHAAPTSNYRGESEENRTVIQKITKEGHEFPIISPEAMRNALREILTLKGLPMNRRRLHDENQLAVEFKEHPTAEKYADDYLFGFMVADKAAVTEMKTKKLPAKRDSVLRMNMALALEPYRFDASFHQSPLNAGDSTWKNSKTSALLHRETAHTAFQYPFALAGADVEKGEGKTWAPALLEAIGELSSVAGGHARSLFEMAPKSVVVRVSSSLVAGYDSYGFAKDGTFPELKRISANDLSGADFFVGGEVARTMPQEVKDRLAAEGVTFHDNPQQLLKIAGEAWLK